MFNKPTTSLRFSAGYRWVAGAGIALLLLGTQMANAQFSSVTITEVETIATCDEAAWRVSFTVDNPSPTGGWIVQELTFQGDIYDCDSDNRIGWPTTTYYEAWPVAPDADTTSDQWPASGGGGMWNDQYRVGPLHNTYGSATWSGTIGFVANPPGGGPADTNTPNTWTQNGIPMSGGLWATYTKPSFWDALVASGNTQSHNATLSWYCCGTDTDSVVFTDTCIGVCEEEPVDEEVVEETDPDDTGGDDTGDETPPDGTDPDDGSVGTNKARLMLGNRFPTPPADGHSPGGSVERPPFEFSAFPVPFEDRVKIELNRDPGEELHVRVVSLNGRLVYEDRGVFGKSFELDLKHLSKGIYNVQVRGVSSGLNYHRNIVK